MDLFLKVFDLRIHLPLGFSLLDIPFSMRDEKTYEYFFQRRYSWITNNKSVLCKICKRDNLKKDFFSSRNYLIIFISLNLGLSYIFFQNLKIYSVVYSLLQLPINCI